MRNNEIDFARDKRLYDIGTCVVDEDYVLTRQCDGKCVLFLDHISKEINQLSNILINFYDEEEVYDEVASIPYHSDKLNFAIVELIQRPNQSNKTISKFSFETLRKEATFDLCCNDNGKRNIYEDCFARKAMSIASIPCNHSFRELCDADGILVFEKEDIKENGILGSVCLAKSDSGDDDHSYKALAIVTNMSSPYMDDETGTSRRLYRAVKMSKISQELKGVLPIRGSVENLFQNLES